MNQGSRDPEEAATELAGKLSTRTRHVCVLLGAGASRAAGLPDLQGLQEAVKASASLTEKQKTQVATLFETRNLEESLSYLRRLTQILTPDQVLGEHTRDSAQSLQAAMTEAIIPALDHTTANPEAFRHLAAWVAGADYRLPVELFTINYDLLIETGLESAAVPYFDGFVGTLAATFRPELVDSADSDDRSTLLPASFARLWKLHGSVNWEERMEGGRRRIIRRGVPAERGTTAAIYPSDEKYDQSRRVPFVVLMDHFRKSLAVPETVTLVAGYAFGDQDLNEIMFDAARTHPRSEIVVLCFGEIPESAASAATAMRNITVLAAKESVIGGQRMPWARSAESPGVWESGQFRLGDFGQLARFLATKARIEDGHT